MEVASLNFILSNVVTEGVITTRSNRMKFRLGGSSLGHLGYLIFDMPSVFHRAKTFSTVVTKQVSYQIFICIFFLRVTSPRMGIRL